MFRLDQKTAIITGAGSGIGRAIALLFARQGATVFILDIDETGGNSTAAAITTADGKNMASVAASVGIADRFAYSTTKGAIAAMTMSKATL